MTSGERAVWAAEFVRRMAPLDVTSEANLISAADGATGLIQDLRYILVQDRNRQESRLDTGTAEMLADMLDPGPDV